MKYLYFQLIAVFGLVGLFVACGNTPPSPATTPASVLGTETAVSAATSVPPTSASADAANTVRDLVVLYTNDEHGWMEGTAPDAGAANLMGLWREREGYQAGGHVLILSGGDMWTGPAISTWFDGESMAEVMNAMGYAAAAVGNHEFDFGLDNLQTRAAQSQFPFLSANLRYHDGSVPTALGVQPYTLVTVNDIVVGIIGLTTTSTPYTTNPVQVADFEFIDYETALREFVPQVKAAGADLILVAAHACRDEVELLARQVDDLGIALIGGGHCNELFTDTIAGTVVLEGGSYMKSYARAAFQVDLADDTVTAVDHNIVYNQDGSLDPDIAAIVARWQESAAAELNVVIGYTEEGVARRSQEMESLITEAWLWSYPTADVAITNQGGIRAALPAGEITIGDVIGVMPFNNVLIELTLTGTQLQRVLNLAQNEAIGGAYRQGNIWMLHSTGAEIDPQQTYHLLVNDFMYAGGDNYGLLAEIDPQAYNTAIDWRQPVIDWVLAQASSPDQPVDAAITALGNVHK